MAPPDSTTDDPIWKWFHDIRDQGHVARRPRDATARTARSCSTTARTREVGRFNFTNGWPSKISTDQLSIDSNDPVKETITLVFERLDRVK